MKFSFDTPLLANHEVVAVCNVSHCSIAVLYHWATYCNGGRSSFVACQHKLCTAVLPDYCSNFPQQAMHASWRCVRFWLKSSSAIGNFQLPLLVAMFVSMLY